LAVESETAVELEIWHYSCHLYFIHTLKHTLYKIFLSVCYMFLILSIPSGTEEDKLSVESVQANINDRKRTRESKFDSRVKLR